MSATNRDFWSMRDPDNQFVTYEDLQGELPPDKLSCPFEQQQVASGTARGVADQRRRRRRSQASRPRTTSNGRSLNPTEKMYNMSEAKHPEIRTNIRNAKKAKNQRSRHNEYIGSLHSNFQSVTQERNHLADEKKKLETSIEELMLWNNEFTMDTSGQHIQPAQLVAPLPGLPISVDQITESVASLPGLPISVDQMTESVAPLPGLPISAAQITESVAPLPGLHTISQQSWEQPLINQAVQVSQHDSGSMILMYTNGNIITIPEGCQVIIVDQNGNVLPQMHQY